MKSLVWGHTINQSLFQLLFSGLLPTSLMLLPDIPLPWKAAKTERSSLWMDYKRVKNKQQLINLSDLNINIARSILKANNSTIFKY